jgi:hypothetical protein
MKRTAAPVRAGGNARPWRVLAVLLTVLAVSSVAAGWTLRRDPASGPSSRSGATTHGSTTGRATAPAAPAVRPTAVRIKSIDVAARIQPMGIKADHTVEVPANPDNVGWYSLGSIPGQAGSAVLLGHVDSVHGPAVFAGLHWLSRGAEVEVTISDGSISHFEVTKSVTYPNADFPARRIYRVTGRPGITLVTCGGDYDRARGGYQANLVVYAVLVGTTRPRPPPATSG